MKDPKPLTDNAWLGCAVRFLIVTVVINDDDLGRTDVEALVRARSTRGLERLPISHVVRELAHEVLEPIWFEIVERQRV